MDAPQADAISVNPAALGEGAAIARGVTDGVLHCREELPHAAGAGVAGDRACADALVRTVRLVERAIEEGAAGVSRLADVLHVAQGTYQLADATAVPSGPSP